MTAIHRPLGFRFALSLALAGLPHHASAVAANSCADACLFDATSGAARCQLWDTSTQSWIDPTDIGPDQLHNRARLYLPWLRERMMPAGGVMATVFTDTSLETVSSYGGERDPAIWTGAYLGAEALRLMATGSSDARAQVIETTQVLHRWWNIPGDPGYLARFAAPSDSDPAILATLPADDDEVHIGTRYGEQTWNWRGDVSRDQYQGVLLGYTLAYDAIGDPSLRELIRGDLVEFAEQLMRREEREVAIIINGRRRVVELELENVLYLESEMRDGMPTLEIDIGTGDVRGYGILVFWPRPSEYIRQIPGFGWVPEVKLSTQAIQLAAAFRAALHVSNDAPEYAARHAALADYYEQNFADWFDLASDWKRRNDCGDAYHGINIAFMPAYTWARLESDVLRRAQIRRDVLQGRLWPAVAEDKNVFFAFLYASQAPLGTPLEAMLEFHVSQLAGFRTPPNQAVPVDVRGLYPEDPECPGQSSIALDVSQRVPASFIWQDKPFDWYDPGFERRVFGGVDYLLAYWLGRYYGFIEDDAPGTCLAYSTAPPFAAKPELTANDQSDSLALAAGQLLTVEAGLQVEPILAGEDADWWIAASSDGRWFNYLHARGRWTEVGDDPTRLSPSYQGPLMDLAPFPVLKSRFLPTGRYQVYFGVDTVMDGALHLDQTYLDSITVNIE